VLSIGGFKEKILAAHRAGITTVIVPTQNRKDMVDVPKKVQREMKIVFADKMDDVLRTALIISKKKKSKSASAASSARS
jgi:ATP-dependent Lon protease